MKAYTLYFVLIISSSFIFGCSGGSGGKNDTSGPKTFEEGLKGKPGNFFDTWNSESCTFTLDNEKQPGQCDLMVKIKDEGNSSIFFTISNWSFTDNFNVYVNGNEISGGNVGSEGKIGSQALIFNYNTSFSDHPNVVSMEMTSTNVAKFTWKYLIYVDNIAHTHDYTAILKRTPQRP